MKKSRTEPLEGCERRTIAFVILFFWAIVGVRGQAVAGQYKCASHSLNRDDTSAVSAAAQAALARPARLFVSWACRNPGNAMATVETRKSTTAEGVKQWWHVECRRAESPAWHCDPAEFHQLIQSSVSIGGHPRMIELGFGKDMSLERAREIATRAISIYEDPTAALRDCASGDVMDMRQGSGLPTGRQAIRVTVNRENHMDSAYLDDVDVSFNVPTAGKEDAGKVSCWSLWVVIG